MPSFIKSRLTRCKRALATVRLAPSSLKVTEFGSFTPLTSADQSLQTLSGVESPSILFMVFENAQEEEGYACVSKTADFDLPQDAPAPPPSSRLRRTRAIGNLRPSFSSSSSSSSSPSSSPSSSSSSSSSRSSLASPSEPQAIARTLRPARKFPSRQRTASIASISSMASTSSSASATSISSASSTETTASWADYPHPYDLAFFNPPPRRLSLEEEEEEWNREATLVEKEEARAKALRRLEGQEPDRMEGITEWEWRMLQAFEERGEQVEEMKELRVFN